MAKLRFDQSQESATRIVDCIFGLHAAMLLISNEALAETIEYLEKEIPRNIEKVEEPETTYYRAGLEICKQEYQRRTNYVAANVR